VSSPQVFMVPPISIKPTPQNWGIYIHPDADDQFPLWSLPLRPRAFWSR